MEAVVQARFARGAKRIRFGLRVALVSGAALLCMAGVARALADEQLNALSHIGQSLGGMRICSDVEASAVTAGLLMTAYDLDLKDPAQRAIIEGKIAEIVEAFEGAPLEARCAAAMLLYGPDGQNVPGLLKWR